MGIIFYYLFGIFGVIGIGLSPFLYFYSNIVIDYRMKEIATTIFFGGLVCAIFCGAIAPFI